MAVSSVLGGSGDLSAFPGSDLDGHGSVSAFQASVWGGGGFAPGPGSRLANPLH